MQRVRIRARTRPARSCGCSVPVDLPSNRLSAQPAPLDTRQAAKWARSKQDCGVRAATYASTVATRRRSVDPVTEQWAHGAELEYDPPDCGWFGARGLVYISTSVEERVLLIRAEDREGACVRALELFEEYAHDLDCQFEGTVQVYALDEPPGDGVEIFGTGRITTRRQRSRLVRALLHEGLVGGRRLRVLTR